MDAKRKKLLETKLRDLIRRVIIEEREKIKVEARAVTDKIVAAFGNRQKARQGNTHTDGKSYFLHNNEIAKWEDDGLWVTNAGWFSSTTKERLNGLPGVSVQQKAGQWYLNGKPWDGKWVNVDAFAH